jgi:hypothetical protein
MVVCEIYFSIRLMTIINKSLQLGMLSEYGVMSNHNHKFCMNNIYKLPIINLARMRIIEATSNKSGVRRICT